MVIEIQVEGARPPIILNAVPWTVVSRHVATRESMTYSHNHLTELQYPSAANMPCEADFKEGGTEWELAVFSRFESGFTLSCGMRPGIKLLFCKKNITYITLCLEKNN